MRQSYNLHLIIVMTSACLLITTGCGRNRTALAPFNSTYGPLAGSTCVAPPPTYSLNIPGAPNQNYYNAQQLPQRQATNTLPTNTGPNVQNGWQPAGTNATGTTNSTIPTSPSGSSTTNLPNSVIENRGPNQNQLVGTNPVSPRQGSIPVMNRPNQLAQNSTNGLSFTDNTNFRSTAVDERLDQSRLPVTDASQVRAPSNFNPTTTRGQFNVPYYVPNQQQQLAQIQPPQRFASNVLPQQQPVNVQPNLRGPNTVVGSFGQPNFAQPTQQPYSGLATQNRVLAQSTVYADPNSDPNFQSGWRDRELTAGRDSINR